MNHKKKLFFIHLKFSLTAFVFINSGNTTLELVRHADPGHTPNILNQIF